VLYLSQILNQKVYYQKRLLGRIADVAVLENYLLHPVSKILIRKGEEKLLLSPSVLDLSQKPFVAKEIKIPLLSNESNDFYLKRNLYGKQVLDTHGRRLVQVHDVLLEDGGEPTLVGIDIGLGGLLRKYGLEKLIRFLKIKSRILPWQLIESFDYRTGALKIKLREEKLNFLHYLELADILQEVEGEKKKTPKLSKFLLKVGRGDVPSVFEIMQSSIDGLPYEEIKKRKEEYGENELLREKPPAWWVQLGGTFINPFTGILIILGITSLFTDVLLVSSQNRSWSKIIILSLMVLVSSVLRFWQEFRSQKASEKLKAIVQNNCTVSRKTAPRSSGQKQEISIIDLVPGDLIHLSAGDMIPADIRLLSSKDLFIGQAALTGESMPVEKYSELNGEWVKEDKNPLELPTLCFMGSNVISGSATGIVVATGSRTFFGSIAKNVLGKKAMTSFDRGVNKVSFVFIRFMLIMVPLVFLINGFSKGNWQEALFFALAVAVGLTPEMLPLVVTANLAKGAMKMAKKKVIVKRLNSIQNFGAMDILCTDKTGTLTEDRVVLVVHLNTRGKESDRVLSLAYLNSYYQAGLKNLIDQAVIAHKEKQYSFEEERTYQKIDEVPFDFIRRKMSVVVKKENEEPLFIVKGAVEEVLEICDRVENENGVLPLDDIQREAVQELVNEANSEGLRVIAIAYKPVPLLKNYTVADEQNLILVGYMGFLDPPKASSKQALSVLAKQGVQVKILTGDNEIVTAKVCREVGLETGRIILGSEIEELLEEQLGALAEQTSVFAKMNPLQKARVIRALKSKGHTVGYMGDGINDASAMRDGDVAISVDSAVDIAKESADIILLEKDLLVLEQGVIEGRMVFGNITKYIKMTASSNFGNVFSVLIGSAFLPFLPMLPIQLLIQNLLYDFSQLSIPLDKMDKEFLAKPRKWEAKGITRFMFFVGPISSVFDIATFLLLWFVFGANSPASQALFQSGWFVEGLLSQTLIIHMIRTQKIPFIQSVAALPVLLLTAIIMAIGILIPFTALGGHLGFEALPLRFFPLLGAILLGYCVLTQLAKLAYIKKFKVWL